MEHTPEPWEVDEYCVWSKDGFLLMITCNYTINGKTISDEEQMANARRIVACVNFCAGITNDQLDEGISVFGGLEAIVRYIPDAKAQRDELLAALKDLLEDTQHKDHDCDDKHCPVLAAREAIAKCEVQS